MAYPIRIYSSSYIRKYHSIKWRTGKVMQSCGYRVCPSKCLHDKLAVYIVIRTTGWFSLFCSRATTCSCWSFCFRLASLIARIITPVRCNPLTRFILKTLLNWYIQFQLYFTSLPTWPKIEDRRLFWALCSALSCLFLFFW